MMTGGIALQGIEGKEGNLCSPSGAGGTALVVVPRLFHTVAHVHTGVRRSMRARVAFGPAAGARALCRAAPAEPCLKPSGQGLGQRVPRHPGPSDHDPGPGSPPRPLRPASGSVLSESRARGSRGLGRLRDLRPASAGGTARGA